MQGPRTQSTRRSWRDHRGVATYSLSFGGERNRTWRFLQRWWSAGYSGTHSRTDRGRRAESLSAIASGPRSGTGRAEYQQYESEGQEGRRRLPVSEQTWRIHKRSRSEGVARRYDTDRAGPCPRFLRAGQGQQR